VALGAAEAVLKRTNALGAPKTLSGLLAGWWREAQATGRKPSTYESYRNTVAGLTKFLNHDAAPRVEPPRVDRRLFRLSHAAMAGSSSLA
jgi:hypothetical protein